jgi:hypothetical protein
MTVMKLTPNANLNISRQLLVAEVDRRINRLISGYTRKITFIDLINILSQLGNM